MAIQTAGRSDIEDFFKLSGVLDGELSHTPLLLFAQTEEGATRVVIAGRARTALDYPDETPVMAQWRGQWRSDFFCFTVGDVRHAFAQQDEALLQTLRAAGTVRKEVGPRGGLVTLRYGNVHTSSRDEAARVERLCREHGITVDVVAEGTPTERYTFKQHEGTEGRTYGRSDRYDVVDTLLSPDKWRWQVIESNITLDRARTALARLEQRYPGTTTYRDRPDLVEEFAGGACKR